MSATLPPSLRWLPHLLLLIALGALSMRSGAAIPQASAGASPRAVPAFRKASSVAVLPVTGIIDSVTLHSLERRMKQAKEFGADAVVLRINTPGGEMFATLNICQLIKKDAPANSVAWIDPLAFSAGTYMALACREIVMSPNGRLGDAAPIVMGMSLAPTERAKAESPLLSEVVDSARRSHYDENLVKAFVTLTPDLWLLEHVDSGQRIVVDSTEYEIAIGAAPTTSPLPPSIHAPPAGAAWSPFAPRISGPPVGGAAQGPAPTRAEITAQIEFEQQRPPLRAPLGAGDQGKWRMLHVVVPAGRLLTLTTDEASYYGLSAATITSDAELQAFFGATRVVTFAESWSEGLVRFLVNPWVRGVFIAIFLVALFLELATPGMGVFGATALVALLLIVGAPALVGLAQWWEVLLVIAGLGLIVAELFIIPGFGIAGVGGALCLLVGLVGTFVSADASAASGRNELLRGLASTTGAMFAAGVAIWLIARRIESLPFFKRFTLTAQLVTPAAGIASSGLFSREQPLVPGDRGTAATDLRPSGRGQFSGRLVDVHSNSGYIDRGTSIKVVSIDRFEIEVESES